MLKHSRVATGNLRRSLKYPSLVSYNKLPWEIVNHETTVVHMHLAPQYEQLMTLAASTRVPHLVAKQHPAVPEAMQLHRLPGTVYLRAEDTTPAGFTAHDVADPLAMQYYGTLNHAIASVKRVRMMTSDDLRLLCLAITFEGTYLHTTADSSLAEVCSPENLFTLYHYFRPNRPVSELTRPLEKFYLHRPQTTMMEAFAEGKHWEPRLHAPRRKQPKVTPMAKYRPPQSYLMGLAERMAVIPGSCFGRRSLMWGHWF